MAATAEVQAVVERIRRWRTNACAFVAEELKATPDPWQEQALKAWEDPAQRRISLQACAGPGKSAVMAWMMLHLLTCFGDEGRHPKGAATSITAENLRDNLWAEVATWRGRSEMLQKLLAWEKQRIYNRQFPETWFITARNWPKTANPDEQGKTLSGMHSPFVGSFIDESGAIPSTVLRAAEQSLANTVFGKIVQAGNPISLEGMLHEAANRARHLWTIIRITGDPDDPNAWVHSPRVAGVGSPTPADIAREQIALYGRDNPWVKSYILGEFPSSSLNSLLGIEDVQAAMLRKLEPHVYEWSQKRLGVDVARFGDDRTVIFPRQGLAAFRPVIMRNERTTNIAARVAMGIIKWRAEQTYVDDTGHWGHGVIDNLLTANHRATGIVFSDPAIDPRFKNRRAEMWMKMAEWVKNGGALPNIPEMVAELTTPTYTFNGGKFQLEEKDQIKMRLGRSPDLADALALTFAIVDMPGRLEAGGAMFGSQQTVSEWNPNDPDRD